MRTWRNLLATLAVLVLLTAACGGGDDDDDAGITFDGDGSTDDGGSGSDDDNADDGGSGGDAASGDTDEDDDGSDGGPGTGGDFETVFGLPPGDSIETDWAPYEASEDEFGSYESVTFEVTGTTVEEVIAHYQASVPEMGYLVDEPIALGDSFALNITDPQNPMTTAAIQAGETGGVITVTHTISRLNPPESTDGDDADDGASSSSSSGGAGDASPVTEGDGPAITINGPSVDIDWGALGSTPFFAPADQASDPFFHIHTNPDTDGFFFSLELYTEWGQAWTGETGGFEISCSDPTTSTGICPYFDPDGPGPLPVLGGDFQTTGQIIINQLGPDGYDLAVGPVLFSDGTVINPFTMSG